MPSTKGSFDFFAGRGAGKGWLGGGGVATYRVCSPNAELSIGPEPAACGGGASGADGSEGNVPESDAGNEPEGRGGNDADVAPGGNGADGGGGNDADVAPGGNGADGGSRS